MRANSDLNPLKAIAISWIYRISSHDAGLHPIDDSMPPPYCASRKALAKPMVWIPIRAHVFVTTEFIPILMISTIKSIGPHPDKS